MKKLMKTDDSFQLLAHTLANLKGTKEVEKLLTDLCTPSEVRSMADRLEVARRLYLGESYRSTKACTGVSTATIARVARALDYGEGGYKLVLDRLEMEK